MLPDRELNPGTLTSQVPYCATRPGSPGVLGSGELKKKKTKKKNTKLQRAKVKVIIGNYISF